MLKHEMDPLVAAIAETEKEVFGSAFGKEETTLDDSGDRLLEEMGTGLEGQHEPEELGDDEEGDEEGDGEAENEEAGDNAQPRDKDGKFVKPEEKPQPKVEQPKPPEGRVPPGRLREQTEKAKAAEAERDALKTQLAASEANHRKELDALNARLDGVLAAVRQQQPTQPRPATETKADGPPDIFEDPKGYAEYLQRQHVSDLQQRDKALKDMRADMSLQMAHSKYGDVFTKAFEATKALDPRNPEDRAIAQRIYEAPNPGEALVQWYKRNETLRQVGDDPEKYKEQIAKETREALARDPEFRKLILEELRAEAEAGDGGSPRTIARFPRSLNNVPGSNSQRAESQSENSEGGIFRSAFR